MCIQTSGRGRLAHGDGLSQIEQDEIYLATCLSHVVWHPDGSDSRSIIAYAGPAFSLCFQPRPSNVGRLAAAHPINKIVREYVEHLAVYAPNADPLMVQKLTEALANLVETAIGQANGSTSLRNFLHKLNRSERLVDKPEFDAPALAERCGMALRSLQKRFRSFNSTPSRWIAERRLERIRQKLDDPSFATLTVRQIALCGGYRDFSYFLHCFKDAFGVAPGRYRRTGTPGER